MNKIKVNKNTSLFLDRDGVINVRLMGDYVKNPKEFELLEGVKDFFSEIKDLFQHVFIVTNQQGIGKGLMTVSDLDEVHEYFYGLLDHNPIKKAYFAPQLAHENHPDRKPGIGMFLKAKQEFEGVDAANAILVGDSISDLEFGKNAGMITVYVNDDLKKHELADYTIKRLKDLLNIIEF